MEFIRKRVGRRRNGLPFALALGAVLGTAGLLLVRRKKKGRGFCGACD